MKEYTPKNREQLFQILNGKIITLLKPPTKEELLKYIEYIFPVKDYMHISIVKSYMKNK